MIFNVIVRSSIQILGDLRPSISVLQMEVQNFLVLFFGPPILLDIWVQVVVPTLSALLADSAFEVVCNLAPVLRAIHMYLLNQHAIFLFCPGTLYHFRIKYLLPSVETLDVRAALKALSDSFPVFWTHLFYQILQFFILNKNNLFAYFKRKLLTSASVQYLFCALLVVDQLKVSSLFLVACRLWPAEFTLFLRETIHKPCVSMFSGF